MARPSSSRKPAAVRTDAAPSTRVQLEQGRVPWVQPWGDLPGAAAVGMPRNAQTERAYSGINVMLLWASGMAAGYLTQRWLTFKQALELGGNVSRGEKGTPVVYANRFTPEGYAREELVAEISAAYVCASLGIVPTVRHADYIASWLEVLRSDPRAIVQTAGMASRSAYWLLGHLPADLAPDSAGGQGEEDGPEDVPPAIERKAA